MPDNDWHAIQYELYNTHLTYDQNNANGCNMPEKEGQLVLIYDVDKPRYFVGRFFVNENNKTDGSGWCLVAYETIHGNRYGGDMRHLRWAYFEPCKEVPEGMSPL